MAGSDRPNLLFVMCDQMRAHALGCYGNRLTRSPFLDSMAEAGTHVEHAISNCPVCVPARTLLLSGQYARSSLGRPSNTALSWTDSWDNPGWSFYPYCPEKREAFPQPTMPELLQRAGYHTAAIGKWHVDAWPHQLGFDDWLIPRSFHAHSNQLFTRNGEPEFAAPGFSVDFEADEMAKFFNRRAQEDAPWFMYYNISPPHMPLADMPEKYLTMYDPGDVTMRDNVERDLSKVGGHGGDFADRAAKYLWDYRNNIARLPHATRSGEGVSLEDLHALYYGACTWVDDTMRTVMQALQDSGMADDTLVVFTSDHGDNLGSHGMLGKSSLNEESCRVPMIWQGAGVARQHVERGVPSLIDVAPTFLSAAGVETPGYMPGTDLGPMLRGDAAAPEHAIFECDQGVGVRTTTHKYGLAWQDGWQSRALQAEPKHHHDLTADPFELSLLPKSAGEGEALDAVVRDWHAATPWMQMAIA